MEIRAGSPSIVRLSWLQLQLARRVVMVVFRQLCAGLQSSAKGATPGASFAQPAVSPPSILEHLQSDLLKFLTLRITGFPERFGDRSLARGGQEMATQARRTLRKIAGDRFEGL